MLEPEEKEIGGYTFTFHPLNVFKATVLDKKLVSLLLPALAGLKDVVEGEDPESLTDALDFKVISEGISKALQEMKDNDFESFVRSLLETVIVQTKSSGAHQCTSKEGEKVFEGDVFLMYNVCYEVMRFNKFSPFALAGRGEEIRKMVSSVAPRGTRKKRGPLSRK